MGMFDSIMISASGLTAQQFRLDVVSNNIANVNTTRTPEGGAYRRQQVVFGARDTSAFLEELKGKIGGYQGEGVKVVEVVKDQSPLKTIYDPAHPDANATGYVELPNVSVVKEMVDMISASRAYEANVSVLNTAKGMIGRALTIGKA